MNRTIQGILALVVAIILGAFTLYFVYYYTGYKAKDNEIARIVNEGNECMALEDYAGAIEKYTRAMDYDPENDDFKRVISYAYVCMATRLDDVQDKIDAYQNALTYNYLNSNAYWGMIDIYEEMGDEDNELRVLQTGYTNTGDTNMQVKADNIEAERERIRAEEEARLAEEAALRAEEERVNGILSQVYDAFNKENIDFDEIKELVRQEVFVDFADEVIGDDNSYYYGDKDEDGKRNGKGLAVYADGYYYFGDFVDDIRSGNGIYLRAVYTESSSIGSYVYEGSFADDKPNGEGVAISSFYKDKIGSAELVKQVIRGNYTDGLENGKMTLEGTTKAGKTVKYTYTSESGVAKKSSDEDSGIKGQYVIAKSADEKSVLSSDGSLRGVEGFFEKE